MRFKGSDVIKIGISNNLESRTKDLGQGVPVDIDSSFAVPAPSRKAALHLEADLLNRFPMDGSCKSSNPPWAPYTECRLDSVLEPMIDILREYDYEIISLRSAMDQQKEAGKNDRDFSLVSRMLKRSWLPQ